MNEATPQTKLDYGSEANELGGGYLKLDEGKYTITPLEELPVPTPREFKYGGENKQVDQVEWRVSCKNKGDNKPKEYLWCVTKAKSKNSTWGQLVRLGQSWRSLMNKSFTLLVSTTNGKKTYTIVEVADLNESVVVA
jgi:hypothetical protein